MVDQCIVPQDEMVPSTVVKLPHVATNANENKQDDSPLIPGRRTFMLNPYASSEPLKLPKLNTPNNNEQTFQEKLIMAHTDTTEANLTLPPNQIKKLTKQVKTSEESLSSFSMRSNKTERLNVEMDKKLSAVQQSFIKFEKSYRSTNETMQDVVRRSKNDSLLNRNRAPRSTVSGLPVGLEKFQRYIQPMAKTDARIDFIPKQESWSMTERESDSESLDYDKISNNDVSNEQEPTSFLRTFHERFQATKSRKYNEENENSAHSSIMESFNDKAFMTKLKIQNELDNKSMQKMQNRASAVQNQLEVEKRKAKLETKSGKLEYKPRKDVKNSPQELMSFLQLKGGKTGSWDPCDHAKFIKIYNTWKGVPELIIEMTQHDITNKTAQEVMAHVKWYEEYEKLLDRNKSKVRKYLSDVGKKKERALIYQMATEGQKTKLENDKRRMDRLKSTRMEENQRARSNASGWKHMRAKSEAKLPIGATVSTSDADLLCREMLSLADKIRSMSSHSLDALSAKKKSKRKDGRPMANGKINHNSKKDFTSVKVELPSLQPDLHNNEDGDGALAENSPATIVVSIPEEVQQTLPKPSKLRNETLSHKMKKDAQVLRRLEVESLVGRHHDRHQDIQFELPNSISLMHSKRGVPSWRKIS